MCLRRGAFVRCDGIFPFLPIPIWAFWTALGHPADLLQVLIPANLKQELETVWPDAFQFSFKFMLMTADHSETLISETLSSPMQFACFQHRLETFPMVLCAFQMTSDAI